MVDYYFVPLSCDNCGKVLDSFGIEMKINPQKNYAWCGDCKEDLEKPKKIYNIHNHLTDQSKMKGFNEDEYAKRMTDRGG